MKHFKLRYEFGRYIKKSFLYKNVFFFLKIIICLLGLSFVWQNAYAQTQLDSKGTNFWLMFNSNLGTPELTLFITGDIPTTGTVSIPGLSFSTSFTVTPGSVTSVTIPESATVITSDTVQNLGINITAAEEVTVYGLNRVQFTTDAFLGLPVDILGTEYINLGFENSLVPGTQFGIVASQDNTTVTITPSADAGSRRVGVPYSIILNQGQTYQLISTNTASDLTGTVIQADRPIAVFGGHQCSNVPIGVPFCDHLVEQLPPTSTWGQSFLTVPLATRVGGDTFRILASQDETEVRVNGNLVATLSRGQFHEEIILVQAEISANNPVLVAQYSNGTNFDGVTSDPFETLIPPNEQFLANYTVTTPASGFSGNFINIVAPNAAVGAINLDGSPIPSASFTPIGSSGFSGAALPVALGSHNFDGPLPFGLTSYGYDSFDSYGYPGGLALGQVALITNLTLVPETATNPINTQDCVTAAARDQNSRPLVGIRVDFEVVGANPASDFIFTDTSGNAEFCYTGTRVGTDTITASVGNIRDTVTKIWVSAQASRCDVDLDGFVTRADIQLILAVKNTGASSTTDPRDADGNGVINANDARQCALRISTTE
ncbi:MAG: hypothetical protein CTY24_07465 [Methylobacter sp.]|nr:MAG: hypothetical protein CTY24_07465 [Methylobacter sp.]